MESAGYKNWGIAAAVAAGLFIAAGFWVPLNPRIVKYFYVYYDADLRYAFQSRALIGTLAHILGLSTFGFLLLLQLFKFGWLTLVCRWLFACIQDRWVAFFLCVLFAFSGIALIPNAVPGFLDMPMYFWLLAAALSLSQWSRRRLFAAGVFLLLALLAHEQSLIGASIICLWAWLHYRRQALWLIVPWLFISVVYLALIWSGQSYGISPADYLDTFLHRPLDFLLHQSLNIPGIITSVGMLWVVYLLASRHILRTLPKAYVPLLVATIAAAFLPLLVAYDPQRIAGILWLPLLLALQDHKTLLSAHLFGRGTRWLWLIACLLQLATPPIYIYLQAGNPLNCYAARLVPSLLQRKQGDIWHVRYAHERRNAHEKRLCRGVHFWPKRRFSDVFKD